MNWIRHIYLTKSEIHITCVPTPQTSLKLNVVFQRTCLPIPLCASVCRCLVAKPCPTLLWPHGLQPARFLCPWDFLGKNTGVGCQFLLREISQTQEWNQRLPHHRQILYPLNHGEAHEPIQYWLNQNEYSYNTKLQPQEAKCLFSGRELDRGCVLRQVYLLRTPKLQAMAWKVGFSLE